MHVLQSIYIYAPDGQKHYNGVVILNSSTVYINRRQKTFGAIFHDMTDQHDTPGRFHLCHVTRRDYLRRHLSSHCGDEWRAQKNAAAAAVAQQCRSWASDIIFTLRNQIKRWRATTPSRRHNGYWPAERVSSVRPFYRFYRRRTSAVNGCQQQQQQRVRRVTWQR